MIGPGALPGSASTSFLRIAVAGRQTLMREDEEERICTTLKMKESSRLDQPYSSSIKFCIAVNAYCRRIEKKEVKNTGMETHGEGIAMTGVNHVY